MFFQRPFDSFKEQGEVLLLRFANDLEEYGKVEMMPVLEGKRMIIMISPLKAAPKKESKEQREPKGSKPADGAETATTTEGGETPEVAE